MSQAQTLEDAVSGSAPVTSEPNPQVTDSVTQDGYRTTDELIADAIAEAEPVVDEEAVKAAADAELAAKSAVDKTAEQLAEAKDEVTSVSGDAPSVQLRINKLNEKLTAEREQLAAIREENAALREETAKMLEAKKWLDDARAVAKFDPRVRQMLEEHPVLGKTPRPMTIDDFDGDPESYAQYREELARRGATQSSDEAHAEQQRTEKYVASLDASEERCKAHPIYKQFMNDTDLKAVDAEIVSAWKAGKPYVSFEQVFAAMYADRIIESVEQQAMEKAEAIARDREAKKLSQLPPGSGNAPASRAPNLANMTRSELIQYHLENP